MCGENLTRGARVVYGESDRGWWIMETDKGMEDGTNNGISDAML